MFSKALSGEIPDQADLFHGPMVDGAQAWPHRRLCVGMMLLASMSAAAAAMFYELYTQ
jgi:hypothetical protein